MFFLCVCVCLFYLERKCFQLIKFIEYWPPQKEARYSAVRSNIAFSSFADFLFKWHFSSFLDFHASVVTKQEGHWLKEGKLGVLHVRHTF